jgi:hypothetical protein
VKSHPANSVGRDGSGTRTLCAGETTEVAGSSPARGTKRLCATTGARCLDECPCAHHVRAAAEGRIAQLEGHRAQWRRVAFMLAEALREIDDPEAGPMWMRERARQALAVLEEKDQEST